MKLISLFWTLLILISCKENNFTETIQPPKIEITKVGKIIPIDSIKMATLKDSIVLAFYDANHHKTFWLANSNRENIITLFNTVEQEGLFSTDFDLKNIHIAEKNIDNLVDSALVNYDILLTKNLSRYIQKVSKGTLNPTELYTNWDLKENNINFKELLLNFQKKDSFNYALNAAQPNYVVYKNLKKALKIINALPKDNLKIIEIKNKIELNDSNANIIDIKKKLIYWHDLKPLDSITPIYDEVTSLAVKKFQMRHGLAPDAVIGIGTVTALNITKGQRIAQIIANMERWRWYPRTFENE